MAPATVCSELMRPLDDPAPLLAIDEALEEAHLTLDEVAGLVVQRGPGSFTGPRVGLIGVGGAKLEARELGSIQGIEPPPLAPHALSLADHDEANEPHWDATRLTAPIYFRAPAVTAPSVSKKSISDHE